VATSSAIKKGYSLTMRWRPSARPRVSRDARCEADHVQGLVGDACLTTACTLEADRGTPGKRGPATVLVRLRLGAGGQRLLRELQMLLEDRQIILGELLDLGIAALVNFILRLLDVLHVVLDL
jgi:hypothetical protein